MTPLLEIDEAMRSFAEKVFASEVKDEGGRQEISPFDVDEICPISHLEMQAHIFRLETLSASTAGKRSVRRGAPVRGHASGGNVREGGGHRV